MYQPIDGTHIIGIGHRARHGKDSSAEYIIKATKGAARRYSFGTGLYAVARAIFGMTTKDAVLLQNLGTEVGRRNDDERWVRTTYWQIRDERPPIAILSDCRFPNEAGFVKQLGGTLINVNRLNKDGSLYVASDRDPNHPSEVALANYDGWNYRIDVPEGRLDYLHSQLDEVLWDLRDKIGAEF